MALLLTETAFLYRSEFREKSSMSARILIGHASPPARSPGGIESCPYEVTRQTEVTIECENDWFYLVVNRFQDYEERLYVGPKWWVQTMEKAKSIDNVLLSLFCKLDGYLTGENDQGIPIYQTKPFLVSIIPGEGPESECTVTMSMYLPELQQKSVPIPKNADVVVYERPELNVFVRLVRYPWSKTNHVTKNKYFRKWRGTSRDATVKAEHEKLLASLTDQDTRRIRHHSPHWTLYLGNEVWVEAEKLKEWRVICEITSFSFPVISSQKYKTQEPWKRN